MSGVQPCESVADHTCGVALLALALAEQLNADLAAQGLERPLDLGQIVKMALVHDLAEGMVTDLPRRTTLLIGADVKHAAEATAMTELLDGLPNRQVYLGLWAEYDASATPEARLVRDADKLEMVFQAFEYERQGHRDLDEFWEGHSWHYPLSAALFEELQSNRW